MNPTRTLALLLPMQRLGACGDDPSLGDLDLDEQSVLAQDLEQDLDRPSDVDVQAAAPMIDAEVHEPGWRYLPHTDRRLWVAAVVNDRRDEALVALDEDGSIADLDALIAEAERARAD